MKTISDLMKEYDEQHPRTPLSTSTTLQDFLVIGGFGLGCLTIFFILFLLF